MTYKKLTAEQRAIKRYRHQRDLIAVKLMDADRFLLRTDAIRLAGLQMKNSEAAKAWRRAGRR